MYGRAKKLEEEAEKEESRRTRSALSGAEGSRQQDTDWKVSAASRIPGGDGGRSGVQTEAKLTQERKARDISQTLGCEGRL